MKPAGGGATAGMAAQAPPPPAAAGGEEGVAAGAEGGEEQGGDEAGPGWKTLTDVSRTPPRLRRRQRRWETGAAGNPALILTEATAAPAVDFDLIHQA